MSKKILVIEDWEKFLDEIRSTFGISDKLEIRNFILQKFRDCELDVIEFEATVFELPKPMANIIYPPAELKKGERFQFFVVKKEKI